MLDLALAVTHHVLVFGLVVMLAMEVARAAMWVRQEVLLLFPLVGFAAAMARY